MPIIVSISQPALVKMGREPAGSLTRFWLKLLADVDRRAKSKLSGPYLKVQTGNLRSSQQVPFLTSRGGLLVGIAQNVASYAAALHQGSRPHEIRPAAKKVLTGWTYGGAPVFTPLVHHPGTKPKPWLRDSLAEAMRAAGT